jgi:hypothetical protein
MPVAPDFYANFADAVMDTNPQATPNGLDDQAQRRFAIYRNNVHRGLEQALASAYPVVQKLVGEAFFRAMAQAFVRGETKRAPSLALYGAGFAEFIDGFAPARSLPYLADIARLERAWLLACHAADANCLTAADLAHAGDLAALSFVPHPAACVVASDHPIVSLWQINRGQPDHPSDPNGGTITQRGEQALITRPAYTVQVMELDPAAAIFAANLLSGKTVGAAYGAAAMQSPEFDVSAAFASLIASGAFAGLSQGSSQ